MIFSFLRCFKRFQTRLNILLVFLISLFLPFTALAVTPDPVSPSDNPCAPETPGVTSADAGGANESATTYAHDANGNLIEQTDATGRKVKYAYDALNRRISVLRSRWALFLFLDYHMK